MHKLPENTPVNFGDKRLDKRYKNIMDENLPQPAHSFPAIFKDRHQLKAVYRFFDNPKVTAEKLIAHEYKQTISHIKNLEKEEDVLVLQDTAHLKYDRPRSKKDISARQSYVRNGLDIHPSIAVTSSSIKVGLLHADMWIRKVDPKEMPSGERTSSSVEEEGSNKWLQSFHMTQKAAQEVTEKTFFNIADQDVDMSDVLLEAAKKQSKNLFFIVRPSAYGSVTAKEAKLREAIKHNKKIGEIVFEYQRGDRKRLVTQAIKVKKIALDSPKNSPHLDKAAVWAIQAQEKNPPKGVLPIEWLIFTDYPVNSLEEAEKILFYYTRHGEIEIFFKLLKSYYRVEELRLGTLERLKPCLAFYMSIASRLMFLKK